MLSKRRSLSVSVGGSVSGAGRSPCARRWRASFHPRRRLCSQPGRDQAHQQSHLWRRFPSSMRASSKSPASLSDQPRPCSNKDTNREPRIFRVSYRQNIFQGSGQIQLLRIISSKSARCALWVKSRHMQCKTGCLLLPPIADIRRCRWECPLSANSGRERLVTIRALVSGPVSLHTCLPTLLKRGSIVGS